MASFLCHAFWAPPAVFSATYLDNNGLMLSPRQRISFPFSCLRNPLLSVAGPRRISNNRQFPARISQLTAEKRIWISKRRGGHVIIPVFNIKRIRKKRRE